MKALSLIVITFISLSTFAQSGERYLSIHKFVSEISLSHANLIPKKLRHLEVQDLAIAERTLSFKLKNFPIYIELIHGKTVAMKVNGVAFNHSDFKNTETLKKQVVKKFKFYPKRLSLWDIFLPRAHAVYMQGFVPLSLAQNLLNLGYPVQFDENQQQRPMFKSFKSMSTFFGEFNKLAPDLMTSIMGAASKFEDKRPLGPELKPYKLKSATSST